VAVIHGCSGSITSKRAVKLLARLVNTATPNHQHTAPVK
jgi:hypothetical protein